jgi:cation transport ATPase
LVNYHYHDDYIYFRLVLTLFFATALSSSHWLHLHRQGSARFTWILIKHSTSAMTVSNSRGAAGIADSLKRLKFTLTIPVVLGLVGTWTACLWLRLATTRDQQTAALILFFMTITIGSTWIIIADAVYARRVVQQIDSLNDPKLAQTRKKLVFITTMIVMTGISNSTCGLLSWWPVFQRYSSKLPR